MEQYQARELAKRIGGIATMAKPKKRGGWLIGGWADKNSTWVVVCPPEGRIISEVTETTEGD